jgi:hypothetical protein
MKKNITLKALNSANTIEDLTNLGMGRPRYDIGHRGGYIYFTFADVSDAFDIEEWQLPNRVGVYCNYLGGGVLGAPMISEYSKVPAGRKARKMEALLEACRRAYMNAERDLYSFDDDDEDSYKWERQATEASRKAGIGSAY